MCVVHLKEKRAAVTKQKLDSSNRALAQHPNCRAAWRLLFQAIWTKMANKEQFKHSSSPTAPPQPPTDEPDHPMINGACY